jgi:hypothetical protein
MTAMNKIWGERENFKTLPCPKMVHGQDENFREKLELSAVAKDEIQISPYWRKFHPIKMSFAFGKIIAKKVIRKRSLYSHLDVFLYFAKM